MNEERLKELKEEKFSNWEENGKSCVGCILLMGIILWKTILVSVVVECINIQPQSQIKYL